MPRCTRTEPGGPFIGRDAEKLVEKVADPWAIPEERIEQWQSVRICHAPLLQHTTPSLLCGFEGGGSWGGEGVDNAEPFPCFSMTFATVKHLYRLRPSSNKL